jgi:mono/diheme cytochrome c family protein
MRKIYVFAAVVMLAMVPVMLWAAADGAALFDAKCSMCHGAKGDGNPDAGMPAVKGTKLTAEELATYLLKGDPSKGFHAGPVGELNDEQAKAVADFIKALK